MLTEIYYEVDEFNRIGGPKTTFGIPVYAASINWYSKRQLGCMSMSEIMTILIYYRSGGPSLFSLQKFQELL